MNHLIRFIRSMIADHLDAFRDDCRDIGEGIMEMFTREEEL